MNEDRELSGRFVADGEHTVVPERPRRRRAPGLGRFVVPAVSATLTVLLALAIGSGIIALRSSVREAAKTPLASSVEVTRQCTAVDLEAALAVDGGAGGFRGLIELRNRSGAPCVLRGYLEVALAEPSGQKLPPNNRQVDGSSSLSPVTLPPGTPRLGASPPPAGHAYMSISWNDVLPPCYVARSFALALPDAQSSIVVDAVLPGGSTGDLTVCANGRLTVTAIATAPQ